MSIISVVGRKLGYDDVAFGVGSYTYTDVNGVQRTIPEINAGNIPLDNLAMISEAIGWHPVVSSLASTVNNLGSLPTTLYFPAGTYPIAADLTIPSNVSLRFEIGAVITIPDGITLTIEGPFFAGLYQVFSCTGTGKVDFTVGTVPYVCPEWWYAGTGSYHTALNAAYHAYTGTYQPDLSNPAILWGYVSVKLSQVYTVADSPWLVDEVRSGQICGIGRGVSGIHQSGTGDTVSIQDPGSPTAVANQFLILRDFSISGNAGSRYGITTNAAVLNFENLNIYQCGSHGFYSSVNGWEMTFINVTSSENGGDGFKWDNVVDNLKFYGGGGHNNVGIGLNLNPATPSLAKAVIISGGTFSYNTGGGLFLSYGQYNVNSCYMEGNTGVQLNMFNVVGGKVSGNNFYDNTGVVTNAIYINSDATAQATRGVTVSGNMFQGNTINIWQSGFAKGCVIGPNYDIDGTNTLLGTTNVLIDSNTGEFASPSVVSTFTAVPTEKQVVPFVTPYAVDLSLGGYIITNDIGAAVAVTVSIPTNPTLGQEVIFDWVNGAGALTITWNGIFKADTYTTLTASKRAIIRFIWDGTNYILMGLPTELTP